MSLYMSIETSDGSLVERFIISNIGHPDTSDYPADDDLRRYRVSSPDGVFFVDHHRSHGARVLAGMALAGPPEASDG